MPIHHLTPVTVLLLLTRRDSPKTTLLLCSSSPSLTWLRKGFLRACPLKKSILERRGYGFPENLAPESSTAEDLPYRRKYANSTIDNVVHNGRMLEFRFVVFLGQVYPVNVVSESDKCSLVMAQKHYLRKDRKRQIISRIVRGQTQIEVSQDLNIPQRVISRVWSCLLSTGLVDRQRGQETTASEDHIIVD
ncbi:uncharacterized protein TNCV_3306431 [Trichonephila clavipes]|nr:uncharacterized protein TNCV_3306431 [Trichonephila clavipes]